MALNESRWLGTKDILSTRKNTPTGIISIMAHAFQINLFHTTELSEQFKRFALSSQYYVLIFKKDTYLEEIMCCYLPLTSTLHCPCAKKRSGKENQKCVRHKRVNEM